MFSRLYVLGGEFFFDFSDHESALEYFNNAIELDSSYEKALLGKAKTLWLACRYSELAAFCNKTLEKKFEEKKFGSASFRSELYKRQGDALALLDRNAEARDSYFSALTEDSDLRRYDRAEILGNLVTVLCRNGEGKLAEEYRYNATTNYWLTSEQRQYISGINTNKCIKLESSENHFSTPSSNSTSFNKTDSQPLWEGYIKLFMSVFIIVVLLAMLFNKYRQEQLKSKRKKTIHKILDGVFRMKLGEIKKKFPSNMKIPECFISYSWGSGHEKKSHVLAEYLLAAGINVNLDIGLDVENDDANSNNWPTTFISRFVQKIDVVDYIILMGTKKLVEKCNDENLKKAELIEYQGELENDPPIPVVSREMVRIIHRLDEFKRNHPRGNVKHFLIPVCLEGEFPKSFPKATNVHDSAGFHCQDWPNYENFFKLLITILPNKMRAAINEQQKLFETVSKNIWTSSPANLQKHIEKYNNIQKQQEEAIEQLINKTLTEFLEEQKKNVNNVSPQVNQNQDVNNQQNDNARTFETTVTEAARCSLTQQSIYAKRQTYLTAIFSPQPNVFYPCSPQP